MKRNANPGGQQRGCGGKAACWAALLIPLAILTAAAGVLALRSRPPQPDVPRGHAVAEASGPQVGALCGACHPVPPAESFPRNSWAGEVARGYEFYERSGLRIDAPPREAVVEYYERRAPAALPEPGQPDATPCPWPWLRAELMGGDSRASAPAVANVRFVRLFDPRRLDILSCEMARGQVLVTRPYLDPPRTIVIAENLFHPAHAEVVDLDRDGFDDVVVASLGSYLPTDEKRGSVVWLRGSAGGTFAPITLAFDLGRVSDARAADFDGDGDNDLVVAVFGWHAAGAILYLENRTTDPARPVFVPATLDPRHGTIHVPVADLNGDNRPDFVALISQEHETVVAFLNAGGGRFRRETIYQAPHPAFGSSGIELTDLDRDGDLDVLLTNGDALDAPLLRPDQGVRWLENRGSYPFHPHLLATLYGAHRATAADLDGDGDLDVAACTFLPDPPFGAPRRAGRLDAVIVLEQTRPGVFQRHRLESDTCDYPTCDLGDYDGDGATDLVVGRFLGTDAGRPPGAPPDRPPRSGLILWKNGTTR